jgi:hypothetical protein
VTTSLPDVAVVAIKGVKKQCPSTWAAGAVLSIELKPAVSASVSEQDRLFWILVKKSTGGVSVADFTFTLKGTPSPAAKAPPVGF